MKKLFAMILAVAMVLSLASVAFAAPTTAINPSKVVDAVANIGDTLHTYSSTSKALSADLTGTNIPFGKTLYIPLVDADGFAIADAEAVKNVKVSGKWEENGSYIKALDIVKKAGIYCIEIKTTGTSMEEVVTEGTLSLSGKSIAVDAAGDETKVSVKGVEADVEIYFEYDRKDVPSGDDLGLVTSSTKVIYDFDHDDFDEEDEYVIDFDGLAEVTADVTHMDEVLFAVSDSENDDIVDAYPEANLDFVTLTGTFKKTAEVIVYADEDTYLYEVVDGKLVAVDAKYDEWEEGFVFKTKKLGAYVISDVKLNTAAVVAPEAVAPANPSTGAAV